MRIVVFALLVSGLALCGCGKKTPAAGAKPTNAPAAGNPITAPVDYLGAVGQAKKHSERTIDLAYIKQAIQQFYAGEDRYPQDLNELVTSKYLGNLPKPPPGMKFSYNPQNGDFKVLRTQ